MVDLFGMMLSVDGVSVTLTTASWSLDCSAFWHELHFKKGDMCSEPYTGNKVAPILRV